MQRLLRDSLCRTLCSCCRMKGSCDDDISSCCWVLSLCRRRLDVCTMLPELLFQQLCVWLLIPIIRSMNQRRMPFDWEVRSCKRLIQVIEAMMIHPVWDGELLPDILLPTKLKEPVQRGDEQWAVAAWFVQ